MKTIEERAKIYSFDFAGYDYKQIAEEGYIAGAKEQRDIEIYKACKRMCKYCPAQNDKENGLQGCNGTENSCCPTLDSFREYMMNKEYLQEWWYIVFDGTSYYGVLGMDLEDLLKEDSDIEVVKGPFKDYPEEKIEKLNEGLND